MLDIHTKKCLPRSLFLSPLYILDIRTEKRLQLNSVIGTRDINYEWLGISGAGYWRSKQNKN
jgi:hypothetical protein